MTVCARAVPDRPGTVELLVDGVPVPGVRCIPGSARVSARQIEFMAHIQAEPSCGQSTHDDNFQAEEFKEEDDEDNG